MSIISKRQNEIFKIINRNGSIDVNDLFSLFDVSPATIRKDLSALEEADLIIRKRGEAHIAPSTISTPFEIRCNQNKEAKTKIAQIAASLIKEGDSIILDAGSTTLEIARLLVDRQNISILTNSLAIANILANTHLSVSLSGGFIFNQTLSTLGPDTEIFFSKVEVSKAFIGASGVRSNIGLATTNQFEANAKHCMINVAKEVYGVIDNSKFSTPGICLFCNFTELDSIITDQPIKDTSISSYFEKINLNIISNPMP